MTEMQSNQEWRCRCGATVHRGLQHTCAGRTVVIPLPEEPRLHVDRSPLGDIYIRLRDNSAPGAVKRTVEVLANVDYDEDGNVLGVEILGALREDG